MNREPKNPEQFERRASWFERLFGGIVEDLPEQQRDSARAAFDAARTASPQKSPKSPEQARTQIKKAVGKSDQYPAKEARTLVHWLGLFSYYSHSTSKYPDPEEFGEIADRKGAEVQEKLEEKKPERKSFWDSNFFDPTV